MAAYTCYKLKKRFMILCHTSPPLTLMDVGLFMQMDVLMQMDSVVEVCILVKQICLKKERISSQWANPAVAQNGLSWRFADTIYSQTDSCTSHDGSLYSQVYEFNGTY